MKDDILALAAEITAAFRKRGLHPPCAVVLGSHDDGMRLLAAIQGYRLVYMQPNKEIVPVEHPDGSCWMELQWHGIKFHWPAKAYAIDEGYVFT